jgi:hypothetical protein
MSKQPLPETIDWPRNAIFTVGHSTLLLEDFVALLQAYRIECLADIRTVPHSRHNPQFNADTLAGRIAPLQDRLCAVASTGRPARSTQRFSQHRMAQ